MEHLPVVQNPYEPLAARYLGGEYSDEHFSELGDFLQCKGQSLEIIQQGNITPHCKEMVARLMQSWFYFGMLQEMLQIPIQASDFIGAPNEEGLANITTEKLRGYLAKWKDQIEIERKEPAVFQRRKDRFIRCSRITYQAWNTYGDLLTIILGPDIKLSIHLLATCLEHAASSVADIDVYDLPWRQTRNPIVTQKLIDMGWCPTIIEQTELICRVALPYFLTLLGPPRDQSHLLEVGAPGCTSEDEGCSTKHVNNETFRPKHFDNSCDGTCEFVSADDGEVQRIVAKGGIPIVYLNLDHEKPRIEVTELQGCLQYTAFSHVWADGRGNPNANALPLCQLKKLDEYMKGCPWTRASQYEESSEFNIWDPYDTAPKEPTFTADELLKQPRYFWFDTLCIPLLPPNLKMKAIESMKTIYRRANRVIVLDAELLEVRGAPESEEILARITASHWMRRLWTLQEAVLGKIVYFQFADESFRVNRVNEPIELKWFDNEVGYYSASFDFDWRTLANALSGIPRVSFVWSALQFRCVSRIEDQPLCVAILLDMDLPKLLSCPAADRTRQLWEMFEEVPAGILFLPGEKLDDTGLTWALKSFVACSTLLPPSGHPACWTPDGLALTLHGIMLDECIKTSRSAIIAINLAGRIYYIRQNLRRKNKPWKGLDFTTMGRLAIILSQAAPVPGSITPPALNTALGALVEVIQEKEDSLVVKYLRAVSIIGSGTTEDTFPKTPYSVLEKEEKKLIVEATRTKVFQKWIISRNF